LALTRLDFNRYRVSIPVARYSSLQLNNTNTTPPTISVKSTNTDDIKDFIKGNKQDKTQYYVLKDEGQFNNCYLSFLTMACSHKIMDVLEEKYTLPAKDQEIFDEKVLFTFTVIHYTLKTDICTLVTKHHKTSDAQKLCANFLTYMKKLTKVQILSANLLCWITMSNTIQHGEVLHKDLSFIG
jgi:hypothetical protein